MTALLTSLFVVTAPMGASLVEQRRLTSRLLKRLGCGYVFSGYRVGDWVRRLGGGYCYRAAVREIV